uniref:Uncharacterized protein n=1 Tax=Anguilla anguilla TaxID=7936 RepID=A0A0E9X3Q6_ANGAN
MKFFQGKNITTDIYSPATSLGDKSGTRCGLLLPLFLIIIFVICRPIVIPPPLSSKMFLLNGQVCVKTAELVYNAFCFKGLIPHSDICTSSLWLSEVCTAGQFQSLKWQQH